MEAREGVVEILDLLGMYHTPFKVCIRPEKAYDPFNCPHDVERDRLQSRFGVALADKVVRRRVGVYEYPSQDSFVLQSCMKPEI